MDSDLKTEGQRPAKHTTHTHTFSVLGIKPRVFHKCSTTKQHPSPLIHTQNLGCMLDAIFNLSILGY